MTLSGIHREAGRAGGSERFDGMPYGAKGGGTDWADPFRPRCPAIDSKAKRTERCFGERSIGMPLAR